MTAEVSWGRVGTDEHHSIVVETTDELDSALAAAAADAGPDGELAYGIGVQIIDKTAPGSLMLGVGRERAFLDWYDATTTDRVNAHAPAVAPWHEDVAFDLYGSWQELPPEETRITPEIARAAAHEYLRTGERPTADLVWGP